MARPRWKRRLAKLSGALGTAFGVVGLSLLAMLLAYRFLPVPATPLMLIRLAQGEGLNKQWVSLDGLPDHVPRAILAAEDQRFCAHWGWDLVQMQEAVETWRKGGSMRGASTLSMQTTKNVFLWPGRSYLRKAIELPLTPAVEVIWGKRRILEIYLNIAEWGPGVYGIEAAARHHFGVPAAQLSPHQATLLAAILPAPRTRSAARPGPYTSKRAAWVQRELRGIDTSCVDR